MGAAFGIFILMLGEKVKIKNIIRTFKGNEARNFSIAIVLAAVSIAISNISINVAYQFQDVAYVMAIKRVMPFFAFLFGYFYFKERTNLKRKILATATMIAGAVLITVFS